jgi:hypothetical protein
VAEEEEEEEEEEEDRVWEATALWKLQRWPPIDAAVVTGNRVFRW